MDIPLPDDPPPPIKILPPINIQLPTLEIELPSEKTKPPPLNIDLPSKEYSENSKQSTDDALETDKIPLIENNLPLEESRTSSEFTPMLEIELPPVSSSSSRPPMDFVYSPSMSEPSQLEIELPSPVNSASIDNDLSSSQPGLEIDLPPNSRSNPPEFDSHSSSKFTPMDTDLASPSGIDLPPSQPFAPSIEGNSSSKFPWDVELPSKAPLPPQDSLSPWEINLPSDIEKPSSLSKKSSMVESKSSFSEVKASLMNIQPEMDIPMPDDPNRYSPSLPVDDDPPLEIIPPQIKGSRQSTALLPPPLPPLLPPSLGGSSTVLGRTKAKKRLMAFSMTKQGGGAGLSFALSKKPPPVSKDAVKVFDDKGDEGKKKGLKKGQSVDKARDTISEIEELKRKEMMLRENMQILHPRWGNRDSHLYPISGMLPLPEIVDSKKTEEIESIVGELLAKKEKKKDDRRSGSEERDRHHHRSSKSKRSDRDRERERRKKKPKTLPLDWKEFKRDGHKVHHFRRFKFEVSKLESKDKRRHRRGSRDRDRDRRSRSKDRDKKDSKSSSSAQPSGGRVNLLETPMVIRNVLVALPVREDQDLEFPEFLVKYTKTKPQLSYSENPRFATLHFMSRKEMLATVPLDIEEIIFKFLGSMRPKRLKIKSETKELDSKTDDEVNKDLEVSSDQVVNTEETIAKSEITEENEDQKKLETSSESIDVSEVPVEVNKDESEKKTEVKKERKSSCKKLHRNWYLPWKTSQLVPQYFTPNIDDEVEIEEVLDLPKETTSSATTLSEAKESRGEIIESVYPSRKRNISKSSDTAVITEELEPIIRTAIRSKWDSDYEDSQDGMEMEKKIEDVSVEKEVTPVTNGMDEVKEDVTEEIDDDNLGVVPMEIVEERNDEVEEFDNSFEESDKVEPANVVEKLASEYEEFMKMVSFENKEEEKAENSVEDMVADEDEYEDSKHSGKLNDSLEDNIDKHKSFADYLAAIENVAKRQSLDEEDQDASIDKELWETKKLYFNRSKSASPGESGKSSKEHEVDKKEKLAEKGKKKNRKKKVQASKIKKKSKDKKQKKKKKKYFSSESSSSSSSDVSSDESSSSESSSSSDSSSESSSSSSSDSSVDRKKSRKKKKVDKLKDKLKSKKNKKNISSSSSEDDEDDDEGRRKKDKKRKKKKVEKKKKSKVDSVKKLKDKKSKKKRSRESSEEDEPSLKKVKKNKKTKKKEEILENSSKKKSAKKKTDEKKHKEKKLEKELELPLTNSLKRLSHGKEDSETPRKKVRPEKDLNFENISDAEISRFFDTQYMERQKSKDDDSKFEAEIDEDFKKSKEYRRMKKRELDVEDTDSLTKEFEPKSLTMSKKSNKSFLEDTFQEFEESDLKSKEYFFESEKKEKKLNKEKSRKDFTLLDLHDDGSKNQSKDDLKKISKSKDSVERVIEDKEERSKSKTDKDFLVKAKKNEKKEDEDDTSSKTSSKNKKKVKKEKKQKDSDGNKSKKKKRKKKTKHSPKANSLDSTKDEMESVENHIHFLRDENFLFELGKDTSNIGSTTNAVSKGFDEKFSDYDQSCDKSFNNSRIKNDEDPKSNEDNSNGSVQPRNLDWHDDSETRGSIIRRLQTEGDIERVKDESNTSTHNSVLLSVQYGSEDDEKSKTSVCEKVVDSSNSSKSLSKKDLDLIQFGDTSVKKPSSSSPLHQFQSPFNICESDDDSTCKEKENTENRSPESSLGDIELESQDNSFILEKDLTTKSYNDSPENIVKKGVFSEVSIKENEDSVSDKFKIQEETFKLGTNDSDRYSPTLDLDLLSPTSLTGEAKCGSDMSLDSNEPEDSLGEVKKSSDGLNMLDIPLPPPTPPSVIPLHQPPPIPCPAPVPPPLLRPPLAVTPSFKNILNIPPIPPPSAQVETKTIELQINPIRKEPIRLPLTNTRLTLNKPLVKVKPANIFEDDDDEDSNSLGKNLIDSPEKEVQPSLTESESKFDEQAKKKRSRWGMEPEDELPIVKLYLANEVVKQTPSVDEAIYNESPTSKEVSDDTSLFDKEKSLVVEKKFDHDDKIEDGIVNEKRDMQLIEVSNIDVENAQEAWKDQENFSALQEEQNSENVEISRNADKQSIDLNVLESVSTAQTKNQNNTDEINVGAVSNKRNNENIDNSNNLALDSGLSNKLPVERDTEEFAKTDSRRERSKSRTDESHRRKDYSEDRTRSSRRRDSRDRRQRRDSSRDRREHSRTDRSRSKERRRDRSRDRYRKRDYPDRKVKSRDRSRERRRRDSPRDRKREKSPRRREGSRESPRRRGDVKESPRRREDIKESPKKKEDTKESPEKRETTRDSPGRLEGTRERKPQIVTENQVETDSESSEDEEIDNNVEDVILAIKQEPVDDGYEIIKENYLESKKSELIIPTKIESIPLETISKHKEELPPPPEPKTQKIKINLKNPKMSTVPRKASPLGFKRSLADSTISDSELIPVKKLIRTSVCLSPKRLSLDDRIELELGVKKSPPPPPAPQMLHHQTYYQIPVHDGSQLTPQVLPVLQPRRAPTTLVQPPRVDWDAEVFAAASCPPPVPAAKSQVLQVGNILQVVPTEMAIVPAPPTSTPAPAPVPVAAPIIQQENLQQLTNKVLQIGNMIQVVPTPAAPTLTPAQIFANAIANAVASVASSKPSPLVPKLDPSPVVKPTLPVAPVQPTVPVVPPSPEEQVLPKHMMSPLLLPLPVAKKAISLPPLPDGDSRRLEKERRKREKEMRRQQKQKKATKKMIREALLMKEALESSDMENDDVRLSEEEGTDEEEPVVTPDVLNTPVRNKFFSPLPPPPGKGILVSPGFREKPVLATKPIETRKVSFADGVHPGEGTSPSASEEHPHSPPPQQSNPKDKHYKKKKKKRKVKVRIIRVEEGDEDDDDDDGSPPPPPPGSPPPMFHYPPPPPGFMYAPPPSFTVLQGGGDGQTFAPVYQQHHSSTTTTHTTTVQFAPPPPPPVSKHARK